MMYCTFNGKTYEICDSWEDVTLQRWIESIQLLSNQPESVKQFLSTPDYELMIDDKLKVNDWAVEWIANYTTLPKEIIAALPVSSDDVMNLTLMRLLFTTNIFITPPSQGDFTIHNEFKYKDQKYRVGDYKETFGVKIPYGNETTGHVTDHMALQQIASQFMGVFNEKVDDRFDVLFPLFIAYGIYPIEKGNPVYLSSEERKQIDLSDLTMDIVWSVYFFLLSSYSFTTPDSAIWGMENRIPNYKSTGTNPQ